MSWKIGYVAAPSLAALLGMTPAVAADADTATTIEAIRAATARFQNVDDALAAGYIPDPSGHCVSAASEGLPAEWGSMGIHYLQPGILGIRATTPRVDGANTHTDFMNPSILLYEPQADGSLRLVGVENLVFEKGWREAGNTEPPRILTRTWDRMADDPATPRDEAHGFADHFDQHVWLVGDPEHALTPFNPAVTCEHHRIATIIPASR